MTDTILAEALNAIPGHAELTDAIANVEAHTRTLATAAVPDAAAITNEVYAAVVTGEQVPDDLGARLVAAEEDQRRRQAAARMLGVRAGTARHGLIGRLLNERDELVRRHTDDALAVVRDALADVIDATIEADHALGPVSSAEQALAAGTEAGAAWRDLAEQVRRYDELRSAQTEILVSARHERARVRPDLEDAGIHRDAHLIDPRWQARVAGEEPVPDDAVLAARAPWPSPLPTRGAGPWPTNDKPSFLRWIAVTDAVRPWVPTRSQLASQLAALEAAVTDAAAARRAPAGPSVERNLVAAGIESRARFRH
jgi:hypothetical protein